MSTPNRPCRAPRIALSLSLLLLAVASCGESTAPEREQVASIALVTPPPETAMRNVPLAVQPVVELRSAGGERLRQAGVEIQAEVSGGTLGGTTSVTTDAEGRAAFTDLAVNGQGGVVLRFRCCDVAPAEHPLAVYLGEAGNVLGLSSPQTVEARAGTTLLPGPAVNLTSELSLPVEGAVVHFTLEGGGTIPVTSVTTNAEGVAQLPSFVFPDRPGTSLLHARTEAGQHVRFTLKATADGEVQFVGAASGYTGEPGAQFTAPPVLVTYWGVPQAGVAVAFTRSGGSDGPVAVRVVTDASGQTPAVSLPLSRDAGTNLYEVLAIGYSTNPLVLEAFGAPGAPLRLIAGTPSDVSSLENESGRTLIWVAAVNSAGAPAAGVPVRMRKVGEAGVLEWWDMFGPAGASGEHPTDEFGGVALSWQVPSEPGTYRIEVSAPYVAEPLVFTAVRE